MRLLTLAIILAVSTNGVSAADEPEATPYRPGVSTPAELSRPGWFEMELGWQREKSAASGRRDSFPYTFKLAFSADWGVRVDGEAQVKSRDPDGTTLSGRGDTAVVLKRRFAVDQNHAFGLEAGANFATAKEGLGSGKTDYLLNGIYSAQLGAYHVDLNLIARRLGQVESAEGRWQATWAGAVSHALNNRWGVGGEISASHQAGTPNTGQLLAAVTYSVSKRMVFDFGASRGLTRASPDWALFAGVTVLLGRLF